MLVLVLGLERHERNPAGVGTTNASAGPDRIMRKLIPYFLLAAAPTYGQTSDLLPMVFVRVTHEVSQQISRDWDRLYRDGREWVYCVTGWTVGRTQDGDTAFVISKMELTTASRGRYDVTSFECRGPNGAERPVAHSHVTGDCSPSRADATNVVASQAPFGLIVCGPRSAVGYSRRQYILMQKGVWFDREASKVLPP